MILIETNKARYTLPETWQELIATGHYPAAAEILFSGKPEAAMRVQLMALLSGFNGYELGKLLKAATNKQRQAAQVSHFIATQIFEEVLPALDFIFKQPLLENPLPQIVVDGATYTGETGRMEKQTGGNMEHCAWAASEYYNTKDEQYLTELLAGLYNHRTQAQKFAAAPRPLKLGALLYYNFVEEWWRTQYSFLYDDPAEPIPGSDAEEPAKADSLQTSRLIRMLAGNKRGTVEQVRLMPRDEIYFELAEISREAEDRK